MTKHNAAKHAPLHPHYPSLQLPYFPSRAP